MLITYWQTCLPSYKLLYYKPFNLRYLNFHLRRIQFQRRHFILLISSPNRPSHAPITTPVDTKHLAFKSLPAFLTWCEKEGLLALKPVKGDVVTAVRGEHADVQAHRAHRTLQMEDEKREKRAARENAEEAKKGRETLVLELRKPHQTTVRLFETAGKEYGYALLARSSR
jgi:hypothetical protein